MLYLRLAILIAISLFMMPRSGSAQSETPWTVPVVIARTEGELSASTLVPDDFGRLHLFYPDQPDKQGTGAINYMQWDGATWSQPVDVIVDPEAAMPGSIRAAIDARQTVHLVWHGGNNTLRYASAPVAEVSSARAWSTPETIATAFGTHDVLTSPNGSLYVAYSTWPETGSISIMRSDDGGATWGAPVMAASAAPETTPHEIRLAGDSRGRHHLAWTAYQLPDGWPAVGAFYAQSADGGDTWSPAQQMATSYHGQIGVGTVGDDEVHLVWSSNVGGDGTFHQRSTDGGSTWPQQDREDNGGGSLDSLLLALTLLDTCIM